METAPTAPSAGFAPNNIGGAEELRYEASFPGLRNKTVYLDLLGGVDIRKEEQFTNDLKSAYGLNLETKGPLPTTDPLMAISTTYSGTSGSIPVLLPTWVDQKLYDKTMRTYPLASGLIPRVTNRGIFADYVKKTAKKTGVWLQEGAGLTSSYATYSRSAAKIKYAYSTGEVSGPMMVASKVWQDALQLEIQDAYQALKELEEETIINGDTTGSTYAYAYNGFVKAITTNTDNGSGTSEIELADIDTAFQTIREAKGEPDLIVTDWRTYNRLKQLIRPFLRYGETNKLNFGFEAMSYENVPIIPDLSMPDTATARELHILTVKKQNNIQIRVLQDATFEELAKTADSYKFVVKMYSTMVIVYEDWCYRFYGLP